MLLRSEGYSGKSQKEVNAQLAPLRYANQTFLYDLKQGNAEVAMYSPLDLHPTVSTYLFMLSRNIYRNLMLVNL